MQPLGEMKQNNKTVPLSHWAVPYEAEGDRMIDYGGQWSDLERMFLGGAVNQGGLKALGLLWPF